MTLKQRLAELLNHFNEDGEILPNTIVMGRKGQSEWYKSSCTNLADILFQIKCGMEYRIESAPKRPRKWNAFVTDAGTLSIKSYNGESSPINYTPITAIEDTPIPVSDEILSECAAEYDEAIQRFAVVNGFCNQRALKKAIEHWEANRTKDLP